MKFSCEKNSFTRAVVITAKAIASKTATPILSGILLKASDDVLELTATDNETSIICKLTSKDGLRIDVPGSILISGRYFLETVRNLPGNTVNLEYNYHDKTIKIKSGTLTITLLSMSVEEYPDIVPFKSDISFNLSNKILRNLILKTCYACSDDISRPIFTGCSLSIHDKTIAMAATNTHQLAVQTATLDNYYDGSINSTISAKVLSAIEKMLVSQIPTNVNITLNSRMIGFNYDNMYISTRLIEGRYPDYSRVIPMKFSTVVTLDRTIFASALRRINIISSTNEYRSVKLTFSNNSLYLYANNPEIGYSEETIPTEMTGDDLTISFNANYLIKVLAVMETEHIVFSLNNAISAATLREMDSTEFTYVITPIRTV